MAIFYFLIVYFLFPFAATGMEIVTKNEKIYNCFDDLPIYNYFDDLPEDNHIKIAAALESEDRNSLSWTCKKYNQRFSKLNFKPIISNPRVILRPKDLIHYAHLYAKDKIQANIIKNLIKNDREFILLDIISSFHPVQQINKSLDDIQSNIETYKEGKNPETLEILMPHIIHVFKGDQEAWNQYNCSHHKIYKECTTCKNSIPLRLIGPCNKKEIILFLYNIHQNDKENFLYHSLTQPTPNVLIPYSYGIETFIKQGINVHFTDDNGNTPLHWVVSHLPNMKLSIIKELIRQGADPCTKNKNGDTPLHIEANSGQYSTDVLEQLINKNNINSINKEMFTPLGIILSKKIPSFYYKLFIDLGAYPNAQDENGNTCLHIACDRGSVDFFQYLMDKSINPNIKNLDGDTPLHIIAKSYNEEKKTLLNSLIENKLVNLNIQNNDGDTALHLILNRSPLYSVIKELLANGADPNIKNKKGDTPLHYAIKKKMSNYLIIELINAEKVNLNIQDINGNTALHLIIPTCRWELAEKIITGKNTDLNIKNNDGNTPIHTIVKYGKYQGTNEVFTLMLDKGANQNITNNNGDSPLHIAIKENSRWKYELIKYRPSLTIQDKDYNTPLHLAVQQQDYFLVKQLADEKNRLINNRQASLNLKNENGDTALHIAAAGESRTTAFRYLTGLKPKPVSYLLCKVLIKKGANIHELDRKDQTPLEIALKYNNWHVADLLRKNGASLITKIYRNDLIGTLGYIKNVIDTYYGKWKRTLLNCSLLGGTVYFICHKYNLLELFSRFL